MKKLLAGTAALVCAMSCALGLAACGGSDEITEKKWEEAFGNATSYTVTTTLSMPGGSTSDMTVKVDGDKRLTTVQFPDGEGELYYSKENGEYFEYVVKSSLGVKQKLPMGTTQPMTTAQFDAMGGYLAALKDDFSSFTAADGKFTCATLDKTSTTGAAFTNVSVTFEKGALTRVEYEVATTKMVFTEIGKTSITLPQIGNGDDDGTTQGVAGKLFTYFDVISEGTEPADEEELEQYRTNMSAMGITIAFGTDNTVKIEQGTIIEQTGTYVEDGDTVTITLLTMLFEGKPQSLGDDVIRVCKYDGTDFKFPVGGSSQGAGGNETVTTIIYVILREDIDASALVSAQVTEAEWRAAFSDDTYANSTIKYAGTIEGEGDGAYYRECKVNGADKYVRIVSAGFTGYYSSENGKKYGYFPAGDGSYIRSELEEENSCFLSYIMVCPDLSEHFDDFTYNAATGVYEYKGAGITTNALMESGTEWIYTNITVKIVGGKLAYVSCDASYEGDSMGHHESKFFGFGTTNVTLPTDFINVV